MVILKAAVGDEDGNGLETSALTFFVKCLLYKID